MIHHCIISGELQDMEDESGGSGIKVGRGVDSGEVGHMKGSVLVERSVMGWKAMNQRITQVFPLYFQEQRKYLYGPGQGR
jgi:hypothetical protein